MEDLNTALTELKRKWKVLHKARNLGAEPRALIAIRNKIYEDQDALVLLMCKYNLQPSQSDYGCRNDEELNDKQQRKIENFYLYMTEQIELEEELEI